MTSITCGACLIEKGPFEFYRKQRKASMGGLGRCKECCKYNRSVDISVRERVMAERSEEAKRLEARRLEAAQRQEEKRRQMEIEYQERLKKRQEAHKKQELYRLEHPVPPPHPDPDEGKYKSWKDPDEEHQFTVKSGGFCFGLRHEIQLAAKVPLMSFEEMAQRAAVKTYGPIPTNTAAKNGTWKAFKILHRCKGLGETTAGWSLCHEDCDPVVEIRKIIFDTIESDLGGAELDAEQDTSTYPRQVDRGLIKIPRYVIGTVYDFSERKGRNILEEGIYLVDYQQAKKTSPKDWVQSIKGMYSGGEFDIARLVYEDGHCRAFLLWGNHVPSQDCYFEEGTAPLGQEKWEMECCCPHHGFAERTISVEDYLQKSGNKLLINIPPYHEVMIAKYGWDPRDKNPKKRSNSKKKQKIEKPAPSRIEKENESSGSSAAQSKKQKILPSAGTRPITDYFKSVV